MKRAPRSLQHHVLYRKYHGRDSEISALLGKCGIGKDHRIGLAITKAIIIGVLVFFAVHIFKLSGDIFNT
jgi:hypothetical protein